jgi:two-component system cell cycle sensor histidine kinase/response regulator CckA
MTGPESQRSVLLTELKRMRSRIAELESAETERRRAESALRSSHRKLERAEMLYQAVLRSTPYGLCLLSADWTITWLNHSMSRILQPEANLTMDLVDFPFRSIFADEEEFRRYRDSVPDKLRSEGIDVRELELRRATGQPFWCEISIVRHDPSQTAPGYVATVSDITERKQAEVDNAELQEKFLQSQKMESIGRLAGGVAHDFNNMLTIIGACATMLRRDVPPDGPLAEKADQINQAVLSASQLTRQLLVFSRKQVLRPTTLRLGKVVANLDKMLRRLIGEDIDFETIIDPETAYVRIDPTQMEQVIVNLVVNARDAMPNGGRLRIEAANGTVDDTLMREKFSIPSGPYVVLTVADTGDGMDAETLNHVFEPFFTTKPEGKGAGLGLATVYGIVQQSEGRIDVHSAPGKGTRFEIYLPRVEEEAQQSESVEAAVPAPARGGETVLVVEDKKPLRDVIEEMLRERGYVVLTAADGQEALQAAQGRLDDLDLLLTDVIMPQLSGLELAQRLAQMKPDLRVLYMSGYVDNDIVRRASVGGHYAFLEKPFSADELAVAVRKALGEG